MISNLLHNYITPPPPLIQLTPPPPLPSPPFPLTGPSDSSSPSSSAGPSSLSPPSQLAVARDVVRSHFCALRQQLQQQETVAMGALEAHVRERLCSLRQQQEDLSSLISQVGQGNN